MKLAVLGAGRIGAALGRLWHAAGHEVTFSARDLAWPNALAAELGDRARAAAVPDAVVGADVVLLAVPGTAVTEVLAQAPPADGQVVIDAANAMGRDGLPLRTLAESFAQARWVRAFNTLQARVLADQHHRQPPWVVFFSGDDGGKPAVAQLIRDAGFEPFDLGGIGDSALQEPGSSLWNTTLEPGQAQPLVQRIRDGDAAAADPLTVPFEKLRDHAPDDPAFFFEHLTQAVFQAGISWRVVAAKWDAIREAFCGFDPAAVASLQRADIERIESDPRVIRNKAKIEATVRNAGELETILRDHGSVRGYLASFPDAQAAAADLRRRFRFLGEGGIRRLLTGAAHDAGS
jgi:predicted dinucleotide-binding enzyme